MVLYLTACISGIFRGGILSPNFKKYNLYLAAVAVFFSSVYAEFMRVS